MTNAGHNLPPDDRLDAMDPPCPEERFAHAACHEALVHAWDIVKLLIARIGDPLALFLQCSMRQWQIFRALDLLRPVELMLRRLLLIEAQALAPSLPEPGPTRPSRPRERALFSPNINMERPQTWRAPFRNLQPAGAPRPGRPYAPHPQPDPALRIAPRDAAAWQSCWPLARRIEAVIRVVHDPLPHIRRLALRLRRRGERVLARLPKLQRLHFPRAIPTLNALADLLHLPLIPPPDS
jgi:hypothetical protein